MAMTDTTAINDPRFVPEVDPMFEYYIVEKPRLTYESPEDGPLTRAFVRILEGFLGPRSIFFQCHQTYIYILHHLQVPILQYYYCS